MVRQTHNKITLVFLGCLLAGFPFLFVANPAQAAAAPNLPTPGTTSVILMIGDGMGPAQVEFGRLVEYGPGVNSSLSEFPYATRVATVNIDGFTTDSAAGVTSIATGVKTSNGRLSMNWNARMELTTILEIAETNNYVTGLVATCHLTHATPAGFAAHDSSRNHFEAIAADMAASGVDLLLGGGAAEGYLGKQVPTFEEKGYDYITNKSALDAITPTSSALPLVGLFQKGSLPKESERNATLVPSLSEMVSRAIALLESSGKPFFLMVEGSQIDWACHDNDATYLAHEMIEFEKAVRVAKDHATAEGDIQLLVTADHETGGLSIKGSSFTTALPSDADDLETLRAKRTARVGEISISWSTGGHTSTKVPLLGLGPNAEQVISASHHSDVFSIMRAVVDGKTAPEGSGYYDWHVAAGWWIGLGVAGGIAILAGIVIFIRRRRSKPPAPVPESGKTQ